ncbi:MAG: hypothetical protein AB1512_08095 [Thermodesulfobacteriota bacterium]
MNRMPVQAKGALRLREILDRFKGSWPTKLAFLFHSYYKGNVRPINPREVDKLAMEGI